MNSTEETYNNITADELLEIENLAGLFFDVKSICIAMEWGENMLEAIDLSIQTMDITDKIYCAYFKGRLTYEIQLRQSLKQAASNGSNPAQNALLTLLNQSK